MFFSKNVLGCLLFLFSLSAEAFIDPPILQPTNPVAGQELSILLRLGECDAVLDTADEIDVTVEGNVINLLIDGSRRTDPILCPFPVITHNFPFGAYPEGDYTLNVLMRHDPLGSPVQIDNIGVIIFTVTGGPDPEAVPVLGMTGVIALIICVLLSVTTFRRLLPVAYVIVVAVFAPNVRAQLAPEPSRLLVLLSSHAEAPTPQRVVEWNLISPAPTEGLNAGAPQRIWYLLPFRAEGDFKDRLDANPEISRARLERYVVVDYPSNVEREQAKAALQADPNIEAVSEPMNMEFSAARLTDFTIEQSSGASANYGWDGFNMAQAWQLAGGYALVGVVDSGLATGHPELRSFTPGGSYTRGNYLPAYSMDLGRWPDSIDFNVDEREPEPVSGACPTDPNGYAPLDYVGHGTHVAGLIGANAYDNNDARGTCRNCGIAMMRIAVGFCFPNIGVVAEFNEESMISSVTYLGDIGAQVINQSFGFPGTIDQVCLEYPWEPYCLVIDYATLRQIALIGSSGNDRDNINFPARDPRVLAAGGFDEEFLFWNEDRDPPPNHLNDCPTANSSAECGSNFSLSPNWGRQEVVGAARQVYSTFYPGFFWHPDYCGDGLGPGSANDGYGNCTGTSMSAPQVSGLFGVLRSINPLVRVGDPTVPGVVGVRNVVAATTFEAQTNQPWNTQIGYGVPDGAAAARRMLGKVAGVTARNRVTPLFGFYASAAKDYAYTTSPQTSIAFLINSADNAAPSGASVPGYSAFPADPLLGPGDTPKANAFVLTTEYKVKASHPDLVPLYLMERSRPFPVGCTKEIPGCNPGNRDWLMATGQAEIESLHATGYTYRGINGYVYKRCTPEPSCLPEGTQKLWRKCKTANDDCAIFLEGQRATFEGNGYTAAVPAGYPMHIGYAYPNIDSDGDGLVNGMELVIGTGPTYADTDDDGLSDGIEFPQASVSGSDPCDGPLAWRCPGDVIFKHDFEL